MARHNRVRRWDPPPHKHLEGMKQAELAMLRWLINSQVALGHLVVELVEEQKSIMADITALTAALEEVKNSAEVASAAVLAALADLSSQMADLKAQIDVLTAGAVSQEAIDALTATAADADATIDLITAAVTPAPVEPPVPEESPVE
jgi:hypothetical protein